MVFNKISINLLSIIMVRYFSYRACDNPRMVFPHGMYQRHSQNSNEGYWYMSFEDYGNGIKCDIQYNQQPIPVHHPVGFQQVSYVQQPSILHVSASQQLGNMYSTIQVPTNPVHRVSTNPQVPNVQVIQLGNGQIIYRLT